MVTVTAKMDLMRRIARTGSVSSMSSNVQTVDAFHSTGFVMKKLIVKMEVMKERKLHVTLYQPATLVIQRISSKSSIKSEKL